MGSTVDHDCNFKRTGCDTGLLAGQNWIWDCMEVPLAESSSFFGLTGVLCYSTPIEKAQFLPQLRE
jgi:hypothetical protein